MSTTEAVGNPDATTKSEEPVFFEADGVATFGIVTSPTVEPLGIGVVLLTGGGVALSVNRNRLSVRMARRLAALGYHVIRFDYRGVRQSEGSTRSSTYAPSARTSSAPSTSYERGGIGRFVLVWAAPTGARTALACADRIDNLEGLVLVAAPVRDFEIGHGESTRLARDLSPVGYAKFYLGKHANAAYDGRGRAATSGGRRRREGQGARGEGCVAPRRTRRARGRRVGE